MTSRTLAPLALLAGALAFLTAEALGAAASPAYSYVHDLISDLGQPGAPRHVLMNLGFAAQGLGFATGFVLVSRSVPGFTGVLVAVLAVVVGVGDVVIALFHSGTEGLEPALHLAGAAAAIVGGNLVALVLGLTWWRRPGGIGVTGVVLGLVGLAGLAAVTLPDDVVAPGLVERVSVYAILLWQARVALHRAGPRPKGQGVAATG